MYVPLGYQYVFYGKVFIHVFFPFFNWLVFWCWFAWAVYVFWISAPCWLYHLQIFSNIKYVAFLFLFCFLSCVIAFNFIFIFLNVFFFHYSWFTVFCQFSTLQQGDPVTHTYIHSFSHIIMLHHKWLDIVPSGIQQHLIAYPFQRQSFAPVNPKLPVHPTPSSSPLVTTSLFSKSMIFFSVENIICALY